ncbi:MAG: LAGLIDADG family homing endonuclease [Candidatus Odinarchaeota archaeon]
MTAAFNRAYFDGDGTVSKDGLYMTTKSKRLALDLVYLFLRLGIASFFRKTRNRATNTKNSIERDYWMVGIHGDEVVTFFPVTSNHGFLTSVRE